MKTHRSALLHFHAVVILLAASPYLYADQTIEPCAYCQPHSPPQTDPSLPDKDDPHDEPANDITTIVYRAFGMAGYGDGSSWSGGIGLGLSFPPMQRWPGASILTPGMELSSSYWSGRNGTHDINRLHDAGVTFLLRIESPEQYKGLFLEGGFGLHQLSRSRFYSKNLGRHSQAGSNIAIGYYIPRTPLEISIRGRHLSNARTKPDNSGINQILLRIATRF